MGNETYITRKQAAEMLGVTRQRIHALIKSGQIRPGVQFDTPVVRRIDVEKLVAARNGK